MFYGFIEVRGRCLSIIGGNLNLLPCKCAMRGILYRTRGGGSRPPLPPPTPARRTPEWGVSDSPPPPHPLYGTRPPAYGEPPGGPLFGPSNLNGCCDRSGPGMSVRHSCHFQLIQHYRGRRRGPRRKRVRSRVVVGKQVSSQIRNSS